MYLLSLGVVSVSVCRQKWRPSWRLVWPTCQLHRMILKLFCPRWGNFVIPKYEFSFLFLLPFLLNLRRTCASIVLAVVRANPGSSFQPRFWLLRGSYFLHRKTMDSFDCVRSQLDHNARALATIMLCDTWLHVDAFCTSSFALKNASCS